MLKSQRGQVLPLWSIGLITTLALAFLAVNYANTVRWQIRAQNAADSAAQALVAIQAERFNLMTEMLYASNVEEWRTRRLLDGMLLAINLSGGCVVGADNNRTNLNSYYAVDPGTCNRTYIDLHDPFIRSVNRYTQDITLLNDITNNNTYSNWQSDAVALVAYLNSSGTCNQPTNNPTAGNVRPAGGDCGFKYILPPRWASQRTGLQTVEEDAQYDYVPDNGNTSSKGVDTENAGLFGPVSVDIITCAKVPPLVPNFGPFHLQPYVAIGRAVATDVQVEQDWVQPGALVDPWRSQVNSVLYQWSEGFTTSAVTDNAGNTSDWYAVDYGGNDTTDYTNSAAFFAPLVTDEMSARFGWWNAIPQRPGGSFDPMGQGAAAAFNPTSQC